ncbi:MAG: hypothetical protein V4689_05220 [Verrucomicrobiota bacterium]
MKTHDILPVNEWNNFGPQESPNGYFRPQTATKSAPTANDIPQAATPGNPTSDDHSIGAHPSSSL